MARSPRITIPTLPHHIVQRGNNRQAVFFDDDDYRLYWECLRQAKEKCSCRLRRKSEDVSSVKHGDGAKGNTRRPTKMYPDPNFGTNFGKMGKRKSL